MSVIVDVDTLKDHLDRAAGHTSQPEPDLNQQPAILDVGRTQRLATKAQRKAIHFRQQGRCANLPQALRAGGTPRADHPIGEIHHIIDWAYGGETNLNNLAGLCRKCHALISTGRLQMTGTHETGYTTSPPAEPDHSPAPDDALRRVPRHLSDLTGSTV